MVVILFGVAGAGKTVVGRRLAEKLDWKFYDADQFHPSANIEKMRRGIALTDEDREPWLERLCALVHTLKDNTKNAVLACSALKESYRRRLAIAEAIKLVFLKADYELVEKRLRERRNHFMNPRLLRSQFETLEEPEGHVVVVDAKLNPCEVVNAIRAKLAI
jgi:gluconokinase